MSELDDAVRRWAMGVYPVEAGAELLIRQRKAIVEGAPWLRESGAGRGQRMVAIQPELLWVEARSWSGSERRVAEVALSLIDAEVMVNMYDAMTGLNRDQLELVLAAVAHAAGSHERARTTSTEGQRVKAELESAFPWPSRYNTIARFRSMRAEAHDAGDAAAGPARSM